LKFIPANSSYISNILLSKARTGRLKESQISNLKFQISNLKSQISMASVKRYCLALDLKPDESLIAEYEAYHKNVWPEIIASIKESGIEQLEIYRTGNRLFMIMETDESFSFEKKGQMDASNERVQDWENLMWKYQQALPGSKPGEKWIIMEKIFSL
jgi:L-rhamnose mutarotase